MGIYEFIGTARFRVRFATVANQESFLEEREITRRLKKNWKFRVQDSGSFRAEVVG